MKKISVIGATLVAAAVLCAAPISLHQSQDKGLTLSVDKARARIGRPLTPGSVAGVHRRHHRRAYHHGYYGHGYYGHGGYSHYGYRPYAHGYRHYGYRPYVYGPARRHTSPSLPQARVLRATEPNRGRDRAAFKSLLTSPAARTDPRKIRLLVLYVRGDQASANGRLETAGLTAESVSW